MVQQSTVQQSTVQLISLGRYYLGPRGQGPGPGAQLAPGTQGPHPAQTFPTLHRPSLMIFLLTWVPKNDSTVISLSGSQM